MAKKRNFLRKRFSTLMQKKLVLLYVVIVLAFLLLLLRVVYVNASRGNEYSQTILDEQNYTSNNIPNKRGDIMDSNGTKLATSERIYTVMIDTKLILSDEKYVEPTKKVLIDIFGVDQQVVEDQFRDYPESQYFVIQRDVTFEQEQQYEEILKLKESAEEKIENDKENELKTEEVNAMRVVGIWLEEGYKRIYPYNSFACNLIGFTSTDDNGGVNGFNGLEAYYNSTLNGTDGKKYGYLNSDSQYETTVTEAVPGNSIVTTIDVEVQSIVEKHIQKFNQSLKNGYTKGEGSKATGVLVMNPQNGEIIAMASAPEYNLNDPSDLSSHFDEEYYKERTQDSMREKLAATVDDMTRAELTDFFGTEIAQEYSLEDLRYMRKQAYMRLDEEGLNEYYSEDEYDELLMKMKSQVLNETWKDFCTQEPFEPGSTAKPFTIAAGLEDGVLNGNEVYNCGGYLHIGDHDIYCANTYGHGPQTLKQAMANSCNVALMYIGQALGMEEFTRFQQIFGFGRPSGIDMNEADTSGLVYTEENMGITDLATNAFGQNLYVTMTQLGAGFCSIINGGHYYEPHVVKEIQDQNGNVLEKIEPKITSETISEETSKLVKEYMLAVVEEGTATKTRISGYDIGGKTGTAEKIPRDTGKYVVSFIGYAPQENPEIMVYVVIDEPNVEEQDTGSYATLLAKDIMEDIFPYLGITRNDGRVVTPDKKAYTSFLERAWEGEKTEENTDGEDSENESETAGENTNSEETTEGETTTEGGTTTEGETPEGETTPEDTASEDNNQ